jgi:hypothetical protein
MCFAVHCRYTSSEEERIACKTLALPLYIYTAAQNLPIYHGKPMNLLSNKDFSRESLDRL